MQTDVKSFRRETLIAEFIGIFIILPLVFAYFSTVSPVAVLITLGVSVSIYLYKNDNFDNRTFFRLDMLSVEKLRILAYFSAVSAGLYFFTKFYYPQFQFFCMKENFQLWCLLMIGYPLFSVYPQELIFRAFIFTRYRDLFSSERPLIHLSAIAFSFAHIIYFNPIAILLTLGGGYLFAWTYSRTRSVMLTSIEHSLYGCMLFTIGLGRFFYYGFDKLLG